MAQSGQAGRAGVLRALLPTSNLCATPSISSSRVRVSICSFLHSSSSPRTRHSRTACSCFTLLAAQLPAPRRFSKQDPQDGRRKIRPSPPIRRWPSRMPIYCLLPSTKPLHPTTYPSLMPHRAKMFSRHPSTTKAQPSHIENVTTLTSTASCQPTSKTSKNKAAAHMTNTYLAKTTSPRTPS